MNPLWALFFKDRFRTLFSVYKMSLAEIVFLLALVAAVGIGVAEGIDWVISPGGIAK
jgi:hypothetical protein